jgi:hypothetical protein
VRSGSIDCPWHIRVSTTGARSERPLAQRTITLSRNRRLPQVGREVLFSFKPMYLGIRYIEMDSVPSSPPGLAARTGLRAQVRVRTRVRRRRVRAAIETARMNRDPGAAVYVPPLGRIQATARSGRVLGAWRIIVRKVRSCGRSSNMAATVIRGTGGCGFGY